MTPAQIAHIMALVDAYVDEVCEGHIGEAERAAVEAALRDAPQQAEGRIHTLVTGCDDCPSCVYESSGRYSCERAGCRKFDADGNSSVPPEWCPLPPSAPTAVEPVQRWPVSQDPLTQLQVAAIISERDEPTPEQSSVVEPRDERAEFEAWYFDTYTRAIDKQEDGKYSYTAERHMWAAWQARASKGTPL